MNSNGLESREKRVLSDMTEEAIADVRGAGLLQSLLTRRAALAQLSGSTLAMMAGMVMGASPVQAQTNSGGSTARDIDILNFALNDEYLESEFYTAATTGQTIDQLGVGITGQNGTGAAIPPGQTLFNGKPVSAASKVNFTDPNIGSLAIQLANDERKHVNFVRQTIVALGGTPIAKPTLELAALALKFNLDPALQSTFLIGGRSFCDVGVSAYAGTSKFLNNPDVIQGASRILAVEAYHAGNLRLQIAQQNITALKLDSVDVPPPPANPNYFPVDNSAFAVIRTVLQVVGIFYLSADPTAVPSPGGFFPNGANANLPSLIALTG